MTKFKALRFVFVVEFVKHSPARQSDKQILQKALQDKWQVNFTNHKALQGKTKPRKAFSSEFQANSSLKISFSARLLKCF